MSKNQKNTKNILEIGFAYCVKEPRGDNGLEGYNLHESYLYHLCFSNKTKKKYYRVFPEETDDYYETCGPIIFSRYFKKGAFKIISRG